MPNQAIKDRLNTIIPQIRRRQIRVTERRGDIPYRLVLLVLCITAGFAFSLAGSSRRIISDFLQREVRDFRFDVFLTDQADRPLIEERLLTTPGVRSVRFVTKQEALGRAQEDPSLVSSLKFAVSNPLPESFDVDWETNFLFSRGVVPVAAKWGKLPGISLLAFDRTRLQRLELLARIREQGEVFFFSLLWGGLVVLLLGCGSVLFLQSGPIRFGRVLMGLIVGLVGGGLGASVVWVWLGAWNVMGVVAGGVVGLLGGLGRVTSGE